jgi:hypothetical protein
VPNSPHDRGEKGEIEHRKPDRSLGLPGALLGDEDRPLRR